MLNRNEISKLRKRYNEFSNIVDVKLLLCIVYARIKTPM